MRVLLHTCCGPCAVYTVKTLREMGHDVTGFFYNPNIHPLKEYVRRRNSVREFEDRLGIRVLYKDNEYDPRLWFREITFREDNRCFHCYRIRMERTFSIARRGGFDAVSTTLLYSKKQKHEQIADLGRDLAGGGKVSFLYHDFREGWSEGIETSKEWGMHRQDYCGCLYSDFERRQKMLRELE